jgi:hypothetical protein
VSGTGGKRRAGSSTVRHETRFHAAGRAGARGGNARRERRLAARGSRAGRSRRRRASRFARRRGEGRRRRRGAGRSGEGNNRLRETSLACHRGTRGAPERDPRARGGRAVGRAAAELRPGRDRARDRGGTHESCHVGVRARRSGAGRRAGGGTGGRVSRPSVDAAASWRASAASRRKSSISKTRSANQRAERRLPSESSPRIPAARDVRHRDRKITPPSPRVAARRTARRGDARVASRRASVTHPPRARATARDERALRSPRERPAPFGSFRRPSAERRDAPSRNRPTTAGVSARAPGARRDRARPRSLPRPARATRPSACARPVPLQPTSARRGRASRRDARRGSVPGILLPLLSPRWPPPRSPPRGRARSPPPLGSARASRAGASRARRPSPARRSLATAREKVARAAPRDPLGPRAPPWAGRKKTKTGS